MTITHIVSFKYRSTVSASEREEAHRRFLALRSECRLNAEGEQGEGGEQGEKGEYILDIAGGENSSTEGLGKGFDHTHVLLFANAKELEYYLDHDPAHLRFKDYVQPLLEDAFVFDFPSRWQRYDGPHSKSS